MNAFDKTDPVTSNGSWSTKYVYDDAGNTVSTIDARNVSVSGTYDQLHRLTARDYSDATPDATFTYDDSAIANSKGALTKVVTGTLQNGTIPNPISTTSYTAFDLAGRVRSSQQVTDGQTYAFADYSYNLSGGLVSETYPSGRIVKAEYDQDGDLSRLTGQKSASVGVKLYASAFQHTAAGTVSQLRLGNGRWESNVANSRLQVTQIGLGVAAGDTSLLKLEFGYGTTTSNNGSLKQQKIGYTGLAATIVEDYAYDSLNRLASTTETAQGGSTVNLKQTFIYDRFGNRTLDETGTSGNYATTTLARGCATSAYNPNGICSKTVVNPTINTAAANNRLVQDQDGDTVDDYQYDLAGNVTKDATGKLFAYDAEDRQQSFGTGGSNTSGGSYVYDGLGKRIKKSLPNGATTQDTIFVYDAFGKLAAEYDNFVAQRMSATTYLTTDHLGSPRIATDKFGNVIARHDYTAFGEEIYAGTSNRSTADKYNAADNVRQQFTGYERDLESGLDYAQARYYNSAHGRFTSVDPLTASATIKDPQTFNRYSYALNSPYKFTDPLGLIAIGNTSACGQFCQNSDGGVDGSAFHGRDATNDFLDKKPISFVLIGTVSILNKDVPIYAPTKTNKKDRNIIVENVRNAADRINELAKGSTGADMIALSSVDQAYIKSINQLAYVPSGTPDNFTTIGIPNIDAKKTISGNGAQDLGSATWFSEDLLYATNAQAVEFTISNFGHEGFHQLEYQKDKAKWNREGNSDEGKINRERRAYEYQLEFYRRLSGSSKNLPTEYDKSIQNSIHNGVSTQSACCGFIMGE